MRTFLPILPLLLLGCPKDTGSTATEPAAVQASSGPDVPGDAASRKFADALVKLEITDWSPEDTGQVEFVYQTFSFEKDNSWHGHARVTVIDESVDCDESGHWTMDPASDPHTAFVNWSLDQTNCPGREAGRELRMKFTLHDDGSFDVELH